MSEQWSNPYDSRSDHGRRDTEGYTVTVPAEIGDDLGTNYDWQLKTVGQEYLDGQAVELNQGKVVGGGTILNGMVWTRGSSKDYDTWDDLNNVSGRSKLYNWRWDDLLPYFRKVRIYMSSGPGETETVDNDLRPPERELYGRCRSRDPGDVSSVPRRRCSR